MVKSAPFYADWGATSMTAVYSPSELFVGCAKGVLYGFMLLVSSLMVPTWRYHHSQCQYQTDITWQRYHVHLKTDLATVQLTREGFS